MKRIVLSFLLLILLLPAFASDAEARLQEAERLYREGLDFSATDSQEAARRFEKSEALYRSLARSYPNAEIFICLGNAAFFQQKFPQALYYYREAQSFQNSTKVRRALNATRLRLNEEIEIPLRIRIFESVFFFHYRIPLEVRLATLFLFFAALTFSAAFFLFKHTALPKAFLSVCAVLLLFNFVSVTVSVSQKVRFKEGVLLQESSGRSGDHPVYDEAYLRPIPAGSEVIILEERPGWCRVRLRDRSQCWVSTEAVSVIGESL